MLNCNNEKYYKNECNNFLCCKNKNKETNLKLNNDKNEIVRNKSFETVAIKRKHKILQSTVILLSWLFVLMLSTMVIYFTNQNTNTTMFSNNVIAEGTEPQDSNKDGIFEITSADDLLFLSTTKILPI